MPSGKVVRLSKDNIKSIESYRMELFNAYVKAGLDTRAKEMFDMPVSKLMDLMFHDSVIFVKRKGL